MMTTTHLLLSATLLLAPDPERELVYGSNADGDYDLYCSRPNGADPVRLTHLEGDETWPRWSPDGKRVLFCWERDGKSDLATIDAAGKDEVVLLTNDGLTFEGAWSPDGKRVVFRSARDGNDELYVQTVGKNDARRLTFDPASDWGPDWSPDGTSIVYATASPELEAIARVPAAGGERTILTDMEGEESCPRWSPDGSLIAYNAHPGGPSNEIFVMEPDGMNPRRLTFDTEVDRYVTSFSPSWSPDGKQLTYTVMTQSNLDLYAIDAKGGERRRLTSLPGAESRSDWRALPVVETGRAPVGRDTPDRKADAPKEDAGS